MSTDALQFLILTVSGWLARRQKYAIEYLKEERRVLREKLGGKRIRFTDKELVRYYVLFVIDLESRRVEIAGIVHQPYGAWMKQIARNLADPFDGFLNWREISDS